jgi:hypothetical protein
MGRVVFFAMQPRPRPPTGRGAEKNLEHGLLRTGESTCLSCGNAKGFGCAGPPSAQGRRCGHERCCLVNGQISGDGFAQTKEEYSSTVWCVERTQDFLKGEYRTDKGVALSGLVICVQVPDLSTNLVDGHPLKRS